MLRAWNLATSLWMGASVGSWLDFLSHPTVLVLSLRFRMQGWGTCGAWAAWISISTADPMYSLVLRVNARCSSGVKWYLQPVPVWGQKPPIPNSDESENVVMVGFLNTIRLIEIPWWADWRKSSQRSRSSRVRLLSFEIFLLLAVASAWRRLFMKWRASGMMKQT